MLKKIDTPNAPKAIGPYSQAIVAGGFVYTSGQIPINPATGNVVENTIEAQIAQVLQNIKAVLEAAGSSPELVVKTTCYLKNMSDFAAFNALYEEVFTGKPARSCVAVKELPKDVLVEIEAVAVVK